MSEQALETGFSAKQLMIKVLPDLLAVIASFIAAGIFIGAMGFNVLDAYETILFTSFRSVNGFVQTLLKFVPLVLLALAFTVPLAAGKFHPDVVLIYANPAQMMFLMNGLQFRDYERFQFFFIGEGSCADGLAQCYTTGKPALAIPCLGEREFGTVTEDEMVMALPPAMMAKAVEGLQALAARGIAYPIKYLGYVCKDSLVNLYKNAHVLLMVSLYEGFGRPIIEGMCFDLPIVASNAGSIPEIAADAAIYVDPENVESIFAGIKKILDSPEIREKLICNSKRIMTNYSIKKIRQELIELYCSV